LDTAASRLVFLESSASPQFALGLSSENPRFAAETLAALTLSRDALSERYTIRAVPDTAPITRVVVRFTSSMPRPVEWKIDRMQGGEIVARQLASEEGELWELTLPRPQSAPLTLIAERQTTLRPGDDARSMPLLVLSESDTQ